MSPVVALSTVLPSLLLLYYFHSRDAYPEPARVVWATFALGVFTVIPVLAFALPLGGILEGITDPFARAAYEAFVLAALPEEACKLLVLVLFVRRRSAFDEPMDGLVYGVAASLGFATMENVLYVAQGGLNVAILRALTSIPAHATFGAIMGYYVGQASFVRGRARTAMIAAFAWPFLLHGFYDFPLLAAREAAGSDEAGVASAAMAAVPVLLITAIIASVRLARRLRSAQLATFTTPERVLTLAAAAVRQGSPAWWIAILLGGLVATGGALMALLIGAALAGHGVAEAEVSVAWLAIVLFGAAPLIVGLLIFRLGVRRLNGGAKR